MRRILILAIFLFAFSDTDAQYEPRLDSMPDQRNTFGVNITPAAILFMNSFPLNPRYSAIYKRQVDVNKKIRVTLNYEVRERFDEDLSQGTVLSYSDTTITYRIESANHQSYDLRLGLEWFKPNRVTTAVYGLDLMVGTLEERDSHTIVPRYFNGEFEVPSPFEPLTSYSQAIHYGLIGFDFSIGERIRLGEKLNTTIRWTPEFFFRIPIQETYSDITQRTDTPDSGVEMRLRGIEIYINYLF